jgi:DNA-binding LytR/AlgR family response regulator
VYSIAVCDDELPAAEYIARCVRERFERRNLPALVDEFTSSEKLKKRLEEGTSYDALLVDIDMPNLNGIELCRKFRAYGGDALVVFISNKEAMVFQTFDVQPFRFVRKNHFAQEVDQLCSDLSQELERRSERWLRFQNPRDDTVYSINVQKLMYVEAFDKVCRLCTVNDVKEIRAKLKELETQLLPFGFLQIHRSYLVNPYYIYRIDMNEVLLDNGQKLPLSRRRREQITEAFFAWSRGTL